MGDVILITAYRRLTPAEKAFVDDYVQQVERASQRTGEHISIALHRPVPPELVEMSDGLLERPMVLAAISERITQIAADTEVSQRRIVKELTNIAFSNLSDYVQFDAMNRPTYDLASCTPDQKSAIKKIKHKVSSLGSEELDFEMYDKLKALEILCRIYGLTNEDNTYVASTKRAEREAAALIDKSADASAAYAEFIGA